MCLFFFILSVLDFPTEIELNRSYLEDIIEPSLKPCRLDILILLINENGSFSTITFTADDKPLSDNCIDHVTMKTRHFLAKGEVAW